MSTSFDSRGALVALLLNAGRERDELQHACTTRGWSTTVLEATDGPDASGLSACAEAAVALVDGQRTSVDELRESAARSIRPDVIVLSSFGTLEDAVAAVRAGASDFLLRPLRAEHVAFAVERALAQRALRQENSVLRRSLEQRVDLGALSSKDARMRRVSEIVAQIADTRASVLLRGESGVGKSSLARAIHERSSRAAKPFVVVDCGAIPATLLESTLFGHVRGAFTGANRDKPGMIEAADGGTLFLDEVGNAPLELQARLLRVVQERAFERVGDTRTRTVDVRWISATHRDLEAEARAGRFREDLYWRLNVVSIALPALRERAGDVPGLARAFAERFAAEHRRAAGEFTPEALAALCAYRWPGNVRELEHVVERAVLMARGAQISALDLGEEIALLAPSTAHESADAAGDLKAALAAPERRLIEEALAASGGRRQEAARRLGINRTTLFNKMRRYGLSGWPRPARGPRNSAA